MIRPFSGLAALLILAAPAAAQSGAEMRERTAAIATRYLAEWSADGEGSVADVPYVYGPRIRFFGRNYSRAELAAEKRRAVRQWPVRRYTHRPGTMQVECNVPRKRCVASSITDFAVRNPARGTGRQGSARFELGVSFAGPRPQILFEDGSRGRRG